MKRFISFFTALSITLMLIGTLNISALGSGHTHKACANSNHAGCTHSEIEYEPFPTSIDDFEYDHVSSIIIENDKNYYLTDDWGDDTLSNTQIYIKNATVNFCLNGHTINTKCFTILGCTYNI